jgi:hypothetical protein
MRSNLASELQTAKGRRWVIKTVYLLGSVREKDPYKPPDRDQKDTQSLWNAQKCTLK